MVRFSDFIDNNQPLPEKVPERPTVKEPAPPAQPVAPASASRPAVPEPAAPAKPVVAEAPLQAYAALNAQLAQAYAKILPPVHEWVEKSPEGGPYNKDLLLKGVPLVPALQAGDCDLLIGFIRQSPEPLKPRYAVALGFLASAVATHLAYGPTTKNLLVAMALYAAVQALAYRSVGSTSGMGDLVRQARSAARTVHEAVQALSNGSPLLPTPLEEEAAKQVEVLFAVCEAYLVEILFRADAAVNPANVLKQLIESADEPDTRKVVKAVIDELSLYPLGSMVRLNTKEVGVVEEVHHDAPLRPLIRVIRDAENNALSTPRSVDLTQHPFVYVKDIVITDF